MDKKAPSLWQFLFNKEFLGKYVYLYSGNKVRFDFKMLLFRMYIISKNISANIISMSWVQYATV